jgi:serine/threonine protein kinase
LQTTEKSDVYSIGITLTEAAGMQLQEIWRGDTEAEIIANKFQSSPNISKLSKNQQKFIEKMIKKTAEDRLSAKQLLRLIDKASQEVIKESPPRKNNNPGIITKLDNWADRMGAYADKKEAQAKEKKDARAQARKKEIGVPAQLQYKTKKEFEPLFADQEFPIARPQDRVIAYLIDVGLFGISGGLVPLWFIFKSKGQLTPGRKFYQLLIIDSKTKKPVSGKRALFRGLVLQYAVFTMIPFVSTTEVNGWYIFVSPILISLLMFLPARKNIWDYLTQTTVGKYQ